MAAWVPLPCDLDRDPDIEDLGFWGLVAYQTVCRIVGEHGPGDGTCPAEWLTFDRILRRSLADHRQSNALRVAVDALSMRCRVVVDDGIVRVTRWPNGRRDPTGAKRQAELRDRRNATSRASNVTGDVTSRAREEESREEESREERKSTEASPPADAARPVGKAKKAKRSPDEQLALAAPVVDLWRRVCVPKGLPDPVPSAWTSKSAALVVAAAADLAATEALFVRCAADNWRCTVQQPSLGWVLSAHGRDAILNGKAATPKPTPVGPRRGDETCYGVDISALHPNDRGACIRATMRFGNNKSAGEAATREWLANRPEVCCV